MLAFALPFYWCIVLLLLLFTVARASAETTPSLYYQSLNINQVNMHNIGVLGLSIAWFEIDSSA